MSRRCGCSSSVCTCFVEGAGNATVTGTGSETNPYVVTTSAAVLTVVDTASLDLTLTGDGSPENPYVLSGVAAGGGGGLTTEQIMDYLGSVTTPAEGLKGTGLITVTYSDVNGTITFATTATANSSDAFLLNRDNHTGSVTTIRTIADDISDTAPIEGQIWVAHSGIWTPETHHDAAKADISGSVKQFADWDNATPPGTGYVVPVWDVSSSTWIARDADLHFVGLGANGRILNSQRPKYNPDIVVIVEGDPVPADAGDGGVGAVIFTEAAAPSLIPTSHGANGGANIVAATGVTKATTAVINVGDWVCIPVGTSGEITLPSTYTVTLAAGAVSGGFASVGTPAQQSGSAQQDWLIGRCTTQIPAGTNITVKANQNRVEQIMGIISIPNLLNPSIDKDFSGNGATSTDLTLDSGSSGTLAQADEVCLYALTFNSGLPVIRSQDARSGSGWVPLFAQFDASAAGSTRSMRAYYKVVSSTTPVQGLIDITASDGNSGAWAGKGITLKAA
jgi:hypothetical protein